MVKFSDLTIDKTLTNNKIAIFNSFAQAIANTGDLDKNYVSNNGLLANIFTYQVSQNNEYLDFIKKNENNYIEFFLKIMNLPQLVEILKINVVNSNLNLIIDSNLDKSVFNNIPVFAQLIETVGSLNNEDIQKYYESIISKDTQGNYPSLIISLLMEQVEKILENNLVQSYYQNSIPILSLYGEISPKILYQKYIYDTTRSIPSYILNFGPSTLDSISAIFNFYKLNEIRKLNSSKFTTINYENDNSFFTNYLSNNSDINEITDYYPNGFYSAYGDKINSTFIANFNNYSLEYNIDLSQKYLFYLGIDNDYGWNNATKFLKSIASEYREIILESYSSESGDVIYRINNGGIPQEDYNQYVVDKYVNDSFLNSETTNSNINFEESLLKSININNQNLNNFSQISKNPKVIAIKFAYYQTEIDKRIEEIGKGVHDAWYILDKIVTYKNLSTDDITIILQSYGIDSDKETLNFLKDNPKYIPLTIGSVYDFLEKSFNDLFSDNPSLPRNTFNGLKSVKSYNAFNTKFINKLSKTLYLLKDYIKYDTIFNNFEEYFDQFNFYKLLVLLNNIGLYITNTTRLNGINSNEESLVTNIKIPSGSEIYNANFEFNFKELSISQSAGENGISDSKYLFSGLINTAYNYGNYLSVYDGSPFNRNSAYTIYERNSNGPYQDFANIKIKYSNVPMYYTNNDNKYEVAFINSDIDLVTSLIFDINGDTANYNLFYKQNLLKNLNNSILVTNDNSYISVPTTSSILYSSNIEDILIQNNLSYNQIKEIIIGNKIQNIEYNTDNFSLDQFTDLSSIIFGNSLLTINNSLLKDSSINSINFIIDSSSNYDNCLNTIEANAFSNCVNLNNVILPNNVYTIGNNSFEKTTNLKNFTFSKNLQTIGTNAFFESGIETVYFSSIDDICNNAFNNCNNLLNVTFDNSCKITILNNNIFANCISLNSVTLCDSISKISNCFNNCISLQNINLSKSITEIDANCFTNCINLENINIEDSSLSILNDNLFTDCSKLKRCILPVSITNIGNNVFNNCSDLSYLIINGTIENDLCNNVFSNIGHNVIIYYFSNLTDTSKFNNILNDVLLVDLFNTVPSYKLIDYYQNINVETNSLFKLKNINIEFFIEDFKLNYDNLIIQNTNDLDCSLNVDIVTFTYNNFKNRNIELKDASENTIPRSFKFINSGNLVFYTITFGNNLTLDASTQINVINSSISNKPNIKYNGNRIQYISDYSKDLNFYGVNSKNSLNMDISYHSLINSINPAEFEILGNNQFKNFFRVFPNSPTNIKLYVNYYYTIDQNNNYNCDYNYICYLQENVSKRNLRVSNENCKFEFINENNINKGKLTLRFENDGNISVNNQLKLQSTIDNVLDVNYTKFLFPLFSITDISNESNDLTDINGPPLNTLFNLGSGGPKYYFKNRIDSKILNGTTMNIISSYNNYEKVYKQINFQSEYVYEQSWGLTKGLKANDYVNIEIIFNYFGNCKDISNNKNNIFTKDNNFAIFLDNGTTSSFSNNILKFYNVGYFNETFGGTLNLETSDLFNISTYQNFNYNDNVFNFEISGNQNNIVLNGPSNLIIERGSYFEDFGVMYLDSISNEQFKYYEYPENTYNSISLELVTGVYEISYVVYPFGESGISYELSRTIQVVNSNLNKPTITLGNNIYQEFNIFESSQNIYSLNNLMNYAYDSSGKELPIFNKLLTTPLNTIGSYYEYFYTYDDFGNYNSVKRTIEVKRAIIIDNQTNYDLSSNILDIYIKNNGTTIYDNSNIYVVFKQLQTYPSPNFDISFNYNGITYYTSNDSLTNYDLSNIEISANSTITPEVSNNYLILNEIIEPSSNELIAINNLNIIYKQIGIFLIESSQNVIEFNNIDFNDINSSNSFVFIPYLDNSELVINNQTNYELSSNSLELYIENIGSIIYNIFSKKVVFKQLQTYESPDFNISFNYNEQTYYTSNDSLTNYDLSNIEISANSTLIPEVSNNYLILNDVIESSSNKLIAINNLDAINKQIGLFLIEESLPIIYFNNVNSNNTFIYTPFIEYTNLIFDSCSNFQISNNKLEIYIENSGTMIYNNFDKKIVFKQLQTYQSSGFDISFDYNGITYYTSNNVLTNYNLTNGLITSSYNTEVSNNYLILDDLIEPLSSKLITINNLDLIYKEIGLFLLDSSQNIINFNNINNSNSFVYTPYSESSNLVINNQTNYELSANNLDLYIENNGLTVYDNSNIYIVFKQLQIYPSPNFDISFNYNGITYYTSNDSLTNYDLSNIEISSNSTIIPEVSNNYLILDDLIEPSSNKLITINNLDLIYKEIGLFLVDSSQNIINFNNINNSNSFVYTPYLESSNLVINNQTNYELSANNLDLYIENNGLTVYDNSNIYIVFKQLQTYQSSGFDISFDYNGITYYTSNDSLTNYDLSNIEISSNSTIIPEVSNNYLILDDLIEPSSNKLIAINNLDLIYKEIGLFLVDSSQNIIDLNNINFNNINNSNSFVYTPFIEYTNLIFDSCSNFQIIYDTSNSKLDIYIENSGTMVYNNSDKKIVFKKLHKYNQSSDYNTSFNYQGITYYTSNNSATDYNITTASIESSYNAIISNNTIIINNPIEPDTTKVLSLIDMNRINQPVGLFLLDNSENNIDFNNLDNNNCFVYIGNNVYFDLNDTSYNSATNILSVSIKAETYLNSMLSFQSFPNSQSTYFVFTIFEVSNIISSGIFNFNYKNQNLQIITNVNIIDNTVSIVNYNSYNFAINNNGNYILINIVNQGEGNLGQYINFNIENLILDSNKSYGVFIDVNLDLSTFAINFDNSYGFIYENNELFTNDSDNIYIINEHLLN